jgi:hypothetical protein
VELLGGRLGNLFLSREGAFITTLEKWGLSGILLMLLLPLLLNLIPVMIELARSEVRLSLLKTAIPFGFMLM